MKRLVSILLPASIVFFICLVVFNIFAFSTPSSEALKETLYHEESTFSMVKPQAKKSADPGRYAQSSDAGLLARAINGEGRGEPYVGQVAIGAVIMNRTRDPRFPKTIAGVVYQPGAFTAVTDGQMQAKMEKTPQKAARDALNGWDPTGGCIYYYNPAKTTNKWIWSRPVIKKIGKHNFCK